MRHLLAETFAGLFAQPHQQRRQEQARRDGVDADQQVREIARHRQRETDDAALRGRIGGLADLAVIGGDARGVDHHAALLADRRQRLHAFRDQADAGEGANESDLDDTGDRTVDQHTDGAVGAFGFRDRSLDGLFLGHVADQRDAVDLGGNLLGVLLVHVEHRDLGALRRHRARGGGAEAGSAAGDQYRYVLELHDNAFLLSVS